MPSLPPPSPTVESLLRLIEVRDAEMALLKLTIEKLKATLLRRTRAQFGTSSEQLDVQLSLIAAAQPDALPAHPAKAPAAAAGQKAANDGAVGRKLPEHLPRETVTARPEVSGTHHDAQGMPAAARRAVVGYVRSVRTRASSWNTSDDGGFDELRESLQQ